MKAVLPAEGDRGPTIERILSMLRLLPKGKAWAIEVDEAKSKRTVDQNALMWSIYREIIEKGGEALKGFTEKELHEHFLAAHFGEEERELFGRKQLVPRFRSSKLSTAEFGRYVDSVIRYMAMRGVVIKMPKDVW